MTSEDGVPDVAGDGHAPPAHESDLARVGPPSEDDRDAVRARLLPGSAVGDEPTLRVSRPHVGTVSAQRQLLVDGAPRDAELRPTGGERYLLRDGTTTTDVILGEASTTGEGTVREVIVDGFRFEVETVSDRRATLVERATRAGASAAATGPLEVRAVIPGKVVRVAIAVGDEVTAGQQLLVVEAMKMQNELRAPRAGTIERIGVAVGQNLEIGDVLVVIE